MRLFLICIFALIVFSPSLAFATPAEQVATWTGWSLETLGNVLMLITLGGPIVGNGLALVLTRLGYLNAAAFVARWTPLASKAASKALEAPTKAQAIRAIVEVAKEASPSAPISTAALLLKEEPIPVNDAPILEAVSEPAKPALPPGMGAMLWAIGGLVFLAMLLGCGGASNPCVVAYDKAETPEDLKKADEACAPLVEGGVGGQGGAS